MLCIACAKPGWPLCGVCERGLRVTHDRVVMGTGLGVAFMHTGTAVRLVHNLKYRRSSAAGSFLARAMAHRVPPGATCLVPVRRSLVRRVTFGIDQATELAVRIGDLVDVRVLDVLRPPIWWSQRAGAPRAARTPIAFTATGAIPDGAVLVDDVFTTGATLVSAGRAISPAKHSFLVATVAGKIGAGADMAPSLGGDVAVDRRTNADRAPSAQAPSGTAPLEWHATARAMTGVPDREEHG